MGLGALGARVLLLSCLCAAALAAALALNGALGSAAGFAKPPTAVKVKVVGLEAANATLTREDVEEALELARSCAEFQELLREGYELAGAYPVFKCKVRAAGSVLVVEGAERVGILLVLERDGEIAYALVRSDGAVEVSRGSLAISLP